MTVYKIVVGTSWFSPGNSAGDEPGWSDTTNTTYFIEENTPELALVAVRRERGHQDSIFDILSVELIRGTAHVLARWYEPISTGAS